MKSEIDYRALMAVAFPVALQSLVQTSLGVIDQMMVSRLGGTIIAAAGLATHPMTILFFLLLGVSGGTGIFVAQYYGDRQTDRISDVVMVSNRYGLLITIPIMALAGLAPEFILSFFTTDQAVLTAGASYLQIIAATFLPLMVILINSSALKACGHVKLPFVAGIISVITNTGLNYILIYGAFGMPGYGIRGAAAATLIARIVEATVLVYGYRQMIDGLQTSRHTTRGALKVQGRFRKGLDILLLRTEALRRIKTQYMDVAGPLILGELVFITSITFYTILYGRMGTVEMAAVTILVPLQNITFGLFSGMSTAAAVLLGQSLGRQNYDYAQLLAKAIIKITVLGAIALCAVYALILPVYLDLFALQDNVYRVTSTLATMIILFLPVRVVNMVLGDGIIRSGGETGFMLKMALFCLTGIGIPMGMFAGFYLKLPLNMVYIAVSIEEIVRMIIGLSKMYSGTWRVNLTSKTGDCCV